MPCYHPLTGYRAKAVNPATGKRSIVYNKSLGFVDLKVILPCGRCIGCRLEYSRQWAVRAIHEAKTHEVNCSITLTYDDEHLPGPSLVKEDFQKFMKRLRERFEPRTIRAFYCGEYGEKNKRPHFHACLFNWDFPDKIYAKESPTGDKLYSSKILDELWNRGLALIGEMNFETAAYVARYVTKKVKGPQAKAYYGLRKPEFAEGPRNPGLGKEYVKKWLHEIYPADEVCIKKMGEYFVVPPPKYYDKILEELDPVLYTQVIAKRSAEIHKMKDHPDSTGPRLKVRGLVQSAQAKLLKRTLE